MRQVVLVFMVGLSRLALLKDSKEGGHGQIVYLKIMQIGLGMSLAVNQKSQLSNLINRLNLNNFQEDFKGRLTTLAK